MRLLNTTRIWVGALALVALLLAAFVMRDVFVSSRPTAASVRTAAVTRGNVRASVTATGSVEPATQVNVNFRSSGQLAEVDVKVGDTVAAGQLLGRIDSTSQQIALEQAQASLQSAESRLQADYAPASPDQVVQLQHQLASAQVSYNDTVAQVNLTNQQDAQQVQNDQNQYNADGCNIATGPRTPTCQSDASKLQQDQNKQQQDQVSGQRQVNQASASVVSARNRCFY